MKDLTPMPLLPAAISALSTLNQGKAYWIKVNQGQATDWVQ
jgi:hypothetical protein